ncbi:MAG: glycosyltransferase [Gloeocapsa sp. DLM2.Bin57]|nr:MAG: glycosyltransferase [Gloeocapsa sp. DLM2.Bin57]
MSIEVSIVIPMYNEESNLDYLFERLFIVINNLAITYEIICINDGSKDETLSKLLQYHQRYPVIKVINLSRNFGKEIALSAGIDYANGNAVIPIDADLQDPPELIVELLQKWREGYDVVYATRKSRQGESWLKRFTAKAFYQTISNLSPIAIPPNTGDFRLLDRQVIEAIKQMPEKTRFMKGLFAWVGFKQTSVLFERQPRFQGKTSWNYWRLWNLAIEGITSFSSLPLKIWSYLGLFISFISLLYASFLVLRTLIFGIDVPGYASLIVAILFLGGIQLISLGIIGEYLSRVYEEVKRRPLYLIRESYGFSKDKQDNPPN